MTYRERQLAYGERVRAEALEEAVLVAEAEPELEGEPPLEVLLEVQKNPAVTLRAAVRATKRNIANGIRALAQEEEKGR